MSIIDLALGRKRAQLGGSYSEFFRKLHQIVAGWRHPEGFLLTYLGSGLGLFKKLGGRTAGVSQASLLSVVSLHDLSTWPLHSSRASNMAGKGSQRRYPKRNQQKRPGFLPQKSPGFTSVTFCSSRHSQMPAQFQVKSVKGFALFKGFVLKTTRPTEQNTGPISLRSHCHLNTCPV